MGSDGDLKQHAVNTAHDFYTLLGVPSTANESDIRRAYRRTALKYHPDKVGVSDLDALEKFHLLQIANDVLLDSELRQLYDNACRARDEKKAREAAYDNRTRQLVESLERGERAHAAAQKRKRGELNEEERAYEREMTRLREDTARRRREKVEQLQREAQEEQQARERKSTVNVPPAAADDVDRTISVQFPTDTASVERGSGSIDRDELVSRFSRFGEVDAVILRTKKRKVDGEKHRRQYTTALIVFKMVDSAHAAIRTILELRQNEMGGSPSDWSVFETVRYANGKEPDHVTKASWSRTNGVESAKNASADGNSKKVPSFSGFKAVKQDILQNRSRSLNTKDVSGGNSSTEASTTANDKGLEHQREAERERLREQT